MTPDMLAAELRSIATRIEKSRSPDRHLVAAAVQRVLWKLAGRTDVLQTVDAVFNGMGIYPPVMDLVSKDTYEGNIDDGWTLNVQEKPDKSLAVKLNGKSIKDLPAAAAAYKSKSKFYLPGGTPSVVPGAPKVGGKTQAEWEQEFYDRTGPLADDELGSYAFWEAIQDLGWFDWTPASDFDEVEQKMRELWTKPNKEGDMPDPADLDDAIAEARKNFDIYKNDYEQKYIDGTI